MPNDKVSIGVSKSGSSDATDHINIRINPELLLSKTITNCLYGILKFINGNIGSETIVNYNILPVDLQFGITIPIYKYSRSDMSMDSIEMLKKYIHLIQMHFEHFDFSKENKYLLWLFRNISNAVITPDISKLYVITGTHEKDVVEADYLHLSFPKIEQAKYETITLVNDSKINILIDPYVDNYGLYVDYTQSMSELNYMYNALHVHEHLMTYAWKELDNKHVKLLNGSTYTNGICFIYAVLDNIETLKEYTLASIIFHIKMSDTNYVQNMKGMEIETLRTISERNTARAYSTYGRSDQSAYKKGYNANIFSYWSSKPFNILLVSSSKVKFNYDKLNRYISECAKQQKRPPDFKFDYYPIECALHHSMTREHIYKKDTKKIVKNILKDKITNSLYGIDNRLVIDGEDISDATTWLHPLLFLSRHITNEEMNNYVSSKPLPLNAVDYDEQPLMKLNALAYINKRDNV